jgi:serine/threonine protein kinase
MTINVIEQARPAQSISGAAGLGVPKLASVSEALHGTLAGYSLQRVLGRGRRSVVYLAQSPDSGDAIALKVVKSSRLEAAGVAADLRGEFDLITQLGHPNVVRALEHGALADGAYLAMEHAERGSVARLPLPIDVAAVERLLFDAAHALHSLHSRGWVHRDVKPGNLLLRANGSLALADFGCARRCGEVDRVAPGTVVGSPRYAAPEQSQGSPAQPAADIYSLGACLHEMLTSRPPYPGETLTELLGQHLMAPVPRLPGEHAAWQPLLDAMLAKNPAQRLADGQALLAHLTGSAGSSTRQHFTRPQIGNGNPS